jgi:hypothetical protein
MSSFLQEWPVSTTPSSEEPGVDTLQANSEDRERLSRELSRWILKIILRLRSEPMELSRQEDSEQEMEETTQLMLVLVEEAVRKSSTQPAQTLSWPEEEVVPVLHPTLLEETLDWLLDRLVVDPVEVKEELRPPLVLE